MKISDLQPGQQFKLLHQLKFRTVSRIIELGHGNNIPKEHKGKTLVLLDDCKQLTIDPTTEITIK